MTWEKVYTINEYYDGPKTGVADVKGTPHIYAARWNAAIEDFDGYLVSPIPPELFEALMEDWQIFLRWERAFQAGETTQETHPALPPDRSRHQALQGVIGSRLEVDVNESRMLWAQFRNPNSGWDGWEVLWSALPHVVE